MNLRGLVNVTRIGDSFLDGCSELKAPDLAPLAGVTAIGGWFLCSCSSLTAIDLAPLSRLTIVPLRFLSRCYSLQSLDCRTLRSVTIIQMGFLQSCMGLQELDVSSFTSVTRIEEGFLDNCPALRILDLSALRRLDLSAMTHVTKRDSNYLLHDHQLESLVRPETGELATAAIDTARVGGASLHSTALHELDVSTFAPVTRIYADFLASCPALHRLDLSAMTNVAKLDAKDLLCDHRLESFVLLERGDGVVVVDAPPQPHLTSSHSR